MLFDDSSQKSGQNLSPNIEIINELQQAPANKRREILTKYVCSQVAELIGINALELIDPQKGLFEMGITSLIAIELPNQLQSTLECSIPPTLIFNYPTIEAIVAYLIEQLFFFESTSGLGEISKQDLDDRGELSASLENLSEKEIADLLARELAAIEEN